MPNNVNMLDNIENVDTELLALGEDPVGLTLQQKQQRLTQLQSGFGKTQKVLDILQQKTKDEKQMLGKMPDVQPLDNSQIQQIQKARRKVFNLKKLGQMAMDPMAGSVSQDQPMQEQPQESQPDLSSIDAVKKTLIDIKEQSQINHGTDSIADPVVEAFNLISGYITDGQSVDKDGKLFDPKQTIRDAIKAFFSTQKDSDQTKAATAIFDELPDALKGKNAPNTNEVPGQLETNVKPTLSSIVERSNQSIKHFAEEEAKKVKPKAFNLKKASADPSIEQSVMYGPEEKTVDQFGYLHEPISDWTLVERNKGFGLRLPGYNSVDWERAWRENVMDHYTVPFRDKDGNWGGGYIDQRFEVDRNQPIQNRYQLKPGQLRRPVIPERGITESRLEASRTKLNAERGYKPAEKGEPFNWKKAQSEIKKKVTAQLSPPKIENGVQPLPSMGGSEKYKNLRQQYICSMCGAHAKVNRPGQCEKCRGKLIPNLKPKTKPDEPGKQQTVAPEIQKGQQLATGLTPNQTRTLYQNVNPSTLKNAIFFDGDEQAFVIYAETDRKMKFSSFDEAEKYAQTMAPTVTDPAHGYRPKVEVTPQSPAAPNPTAAPQTGKPQSPAAGRKPGNRKMTVDADKEDGIGSNPRHHVSAHGLAIDG